MFDQALTVWEALTRIARVGRAVPFLQGYKSVKWLTTVAVGDEDTVGYKRRGGFIVMPELAPLPEEKP